MAALAADLGVRRTSKAGSGLIDRRPVRLIRTALDSPRIMETLAREIPDRPGIAATAGLVGGSVKGPRFTLVWSDGEGRQYKASGLVHDGTSGRLVTIQFRPDRRNWFVGLGAGALVFSALAATEVLSWSASMTAVGASIVATIVGLRLQLVPRVFVEGITEWLQSLLEAK